MAEGTCRKTTGRTSEGAYTRTRVDAQSEASSVLDGWYIDIRTVELCMAWTLLRQGLLRLVDVRVWLACLEVRERRKKLPRKRSARYGLRELQGLTGGGGVTLKGALRRLRQTGLVDWSSGKAPVFATSPEQLEGLDLELFWEMLDAMPKMTRKDGRKEPRKRVPLPRRTIRFLAGGVNRSVLATALGQLAWCLYYHRSSGWNPTGKVMACRIADTFGLSERSVLRARHHLEDLGWMRREQTPVWHVKKFGASYSVNLEWARTARELEFTLERRRLSTTKMSPQPGQNGTGMSGLDSDQTPLPRGRKNQTPTSSGGPQSGFSSGNQELKKPKLRDIQREDLSSMDRLMVLFDQAMAMGVVQGDSFMERLNFAALAEHSRVRATLNPPGMFSRLLRWGRNPNGSSRKPSPAWHFVTEGDEEAVRVRLTAHLNDEPELLEPRQSGSGALGSEKTGRPKRLSRDAAALRSIDAALLAGRVRPTQGGSLQDELVAQGWSVERYTQARRELTEWKRGGSEAQDELLEPVGGLQCGF